MYAITVTEAMLSALLSRVISYSLERHWIDFVGFAMERYLPAYDKSDGISQLIHVLFISMVLFAITDALDIWTVHTKQDDRLTKEVLLRK